MSSSAFAIVFALVCLAAAVAKADPYPSRSDAVNVTDEDWRDQPRKRTIPVRLYMPEMLDAPAPVILVSHGLGGTRGAMAYAAKHWSANGYIVIALQHPGSDDSVWRFDGTPRQKLQAMRDAANAENWMLRCDDVRFAIDYLESLAAQDGPLAGRVDLTKIGIAGHSFGAQTVQAVIGQRLGTPAIALPSKTEPRIKAAVAFSPRYQHEQPMWAFADVKVPCFHFTGTNDTVAAGTPATVEERRAPYDAINAPGQRLIIFEGGDHAVFGGLAPRPGIDASKYPRFRDLVSQSTLAFFDAELRGNANAKAWLDEKMAAEVSTDGSVEKRD